MNTTSKNYPHASTSNMKEILGKCIAQNLFQRTYMFCTMLF